MIFQFFLSFFFKTIDNFDFLCYYIAILRARWLIIFTVLFPDYSEGDPYFSQMDFETFIEAEAYGVSKGVEFMILRLEK